MPWSQRALAWRKQTWTKVGEGGVQELAGWGHQAEEMTEIMGWDKEPRRVERGARRSLRNTSCECQAIIIR